MFYENTAFTYTNVKEMPNISRSFFSTFSNDIITLYLDQSHLLMRSFSKIILANKRDIKLFTGL